jgi:hypothetical protein
MNALGDKVHQRFRAAIALQLVTVLPEVERNNTT